MITRKELLYELRKDIQKVERQIRHKNLYNLRNYLVSSFLKAGIALDYARPFIMAGVIFFYVQTETINSPFKRDQTIEYASMELTQTSTGINRKLSSFDVIYSEEYFEHSTAWKINDDGLYERTITSYRMDFNPELFTGDVTELLHMSKEEIEETLTIENIETIQKNELVEEDNLYQQDMFILTRSFEDKDNFNFYTETDSEFLRGFVLYFVVTLLAGSILTEGERRGFLIRYYPKDKLRELEPEFRPITKKELGILEKALEMKRVNLRLLEEENSSLEPKTKKRGGLYES